MSYTVSLLIDYQSLSVFWTVAGVIMKFLKWLIGISAAVCLSLVTAFLVAGLLVPAERSFSNEIEIEATAESVWQVITDKSRYTEWQPSIKKVDVIDERNWVENLKDSQEPLRFSLVADRRPESMEFGYSMGDSFHGHWKGEMTSTATGVRLKTTDGYKVDGWITKILIGMFFDLDSFAKDWNSKLKARVESLK